VGGKELWLDRDAAFEDIISQLPESISHYREIVFCGFGEPTCNLEVLSLAGKYLKRLGQRVRLNTNGQANLYYGQDVTGRLVGAVDVVNVSLNASNAKEYQHICKSAYGEYAFDALLEFASQCQEKGMEVIMSVVDIIGEEEIEACRKLCNDRKLTLRVRNYE